MLIAMVLKGLPSSYKPFVVVITQSEKMMNFSEFKTAIRTFEENERASLELSGKFSNVMKLHDQNRRPPRNNKFHNNDHPRHRGPDQNNNNKNGSSGSGGGKKITCHSCGEEGHISPKCPNKDKEKKKQWCNYCKSGTHSDKNCRKNKDHAKTQFKILVTFRNEICQFSTPL